MAVVLTGAVAAEVDGLRRALRDPALGRVPPHVTLVPPVNVRAGDLPAALARLRAAADRVAPFELTLGPPTSFLPANPVLYLGVGGDLDALAALRDAVFVEPLARPLAWPWVPHVTLTEGLDPAATDAAVGVLAGFAGLVGVATVTLLEEVRTPVGRRWAALADAALGGSHTAGTGGLAVTVDRSGMLDPEAAALVAATAVAVPDAVVAPAARWRDAPGATPGSDTPVRSDPAGRAREALVVTARREGAVVGVGAAWLADDGGHVAVLVDPRRRREGVGSRLLARLEAEVAAAGWSCPVVQAAGPAGFYSARGRWAVAAAGAQAPPPGPARGVSR